MRRYNYQRRSRRATRETQHTPKSSFYKTCSLTLEMPCNNSRPAQDYIKSRGLDPIRLEIGYNTAQFRHAGRFVKPGSPDSGSASGGKQTLINNCVAVGLLAPWA